MGKRLWTEDIDEQIGDNQPGCVWGALHALDYHHWHYNVKKLLPHKKHNGPRHVKEFYLLNALWVFPCVSATCGLFYHPHCVAKLLHRKSAAEAEELRKKIAAGEFFTCPIQKCIVCKLGENKLDPDLQFADVVPSRTTENACRGILLLKIWRMRAACKGLGKVLFQIVF